MNQGNIDTLNDLFKEYRVEFQMIALIPVKSDWRLFMKNLFEHTSSPWIRYSSYEYRTAEDGTLYIVVSKDAKPEMYNPMKDAESLVLAAVNIGLQFMHKAPEDELKSMVLRFINSYGFLGFMTALPTTAEFITYESVYLPKNHFIKEESLSTESYLDYFYPFDKMDFHKKGVESSWSVSDKDGIAIALATGKNPQAVTMSFQKEYAERYDWLVKEFSDWAFTFTTSFLYYLDYDRLDEQTKNLYRQGTVCIWRNIPDLPYLISGKCPGYRMELPFPARHNPDVLFFYAYGF